MPRFEPDWLMSILDSLKKGISTYNAKETIDLANEFAGIIPQNHVIALYGDLGAGKTTFVKGLAQSWGINEEVTSPTFNIYTIYKGHRNLLHLDAYRLESKEDVENLSLEEFLLPPYCLVIEWPEKIESILPPTTWHIYLSVQEDQSHLIKLITTS